MITKGNEVLKTVNGYLKSNLLHINLEKCYFMYFNHEKNESDQFEEADGSKFIHVVKNIRYTETPLVMMKVF